MRFYLRSEGAGDSALLFYFCFECDLNKSVFFRAKIVSTHSTYSTMLIIKKLHCRNSATYLLHCSTNFTTLPFFLQNSCFFYFVEFYIFVYNAVNQ